MSEMEDTMKLKKFTTVAASILLSLTIGFTNVSAADYRVVRNDTLYKLSVLFKTPVSTLKSDNKLSTSSLYPGQVLNVPAKMYTIKRGDTLNLIAKRYGITVSAIRKANKKYNNTLIPGQLLMLPGIKPGTQSVQAMTKTMSSKNVGSKAIISYTSAEENLLARLITAEASGQPYDAMVGVGAVVVNRVQSPDWPNTIQDVIYHNAGGYQQFTPVKNGYINNPATEIAKKAAHEALYGADPSNGAMFYFDDSSTNQWLWSKTIAARIGKIVFVY